MKRDRHVFAPGNTDIDITTEDDATVDGAAADIFGVIGA